MTEIPAPPTTIMVGQGGRRVPQPPAPPGVSSLAASSHEQADGPTFTKSGRVEPRNPGVAP